MTRYGSKDIDDGLVGQRLIGVSHNGEDPLDTVDGRLETGTLRSDPPAVDLVTRLDDGVVVIRCADTEFGIGVDGWAETRP